MQLQDIRTEVLDTAGLASDDPRFPTATLNRIINRALRSISSEHDWPWLQTTLSITTAAGTISYSPNANWAKTYRLQYETRDLFEYQPRDAIQFFNDTGKPVGYYIEHEKIHFVPVPDGVYTITHIYYQYETALSGDTDEPALPDRYIDWLIAIALTQVSMKIRDRDLFEMAKRERRDWSDRAHDEVRRSHGSTKPKTRSDWSI